MHQSVDNEFISQKTKRKMLKEMQHREQVHNLLSERDKGESGSDLRK